MDAPRRPAAQRIRLTARVLLGAVTLAVAAIVFSPGPPDAAGQRGLEQWLFRLHRDGLPTWISFSLVEFIANVVMFLPLGLLGALALRQHHWLIVPICAAFSGAIETVQLLALPERDGTLNDVLANASGAALGFLLALLVMRAVRRHAQRAPDEPPVRRAR